MRPPPREHPSPGTLCPRHLSDARAAPSGTLMFRPDDTHSADTCAYVIDVRYSGAKNLWWAPSHPHPLPPCPPLPGVPH